MTTADEQTTAASQPHANTTEAQLHQEIARLTNVVASAKSTIRQLLSRLYGPTAETMAIVFDVEGQQLIDPAWGTVAPASTDDAADNESERRSKRRAQPSSLAERCPQLPIVEEDAPLAPSVCAAVESGELVVERTGRYTDELVTVPSRHFIRRVYEMRTIPAAAVAADSQAAPSGDTCPVEANADQVTTAHDASCSTVAAQEPSTATADENAVVMPMPARIVPGGVLACISIHLLVIAKFLDAMPFNRSLNAWKRQGADIARQTVNDAFAAWAALYQPVAECIIADIFHDPVVHADEGWGRRHQRKRCRPINICTLVGDGQVGYRYSEDTKYRRAREYIPADFRGYLICDAWSGWRTETDARRAGCNAHARRPFAAHLKIAPNDPDATSIVTLYGQVYACEHRAKEGSPEDLLARRRHIRDQETRPIMARIRAEADRIAESHPHSSALARGARYIQNHWDDLTKFLDDPLLPPDNNAAEGALRINALIRKNSLFHGSEDGGHRAACAMTILHSCRLAAIDPLRYLEQTAPQLLSLRDRGRLDQADLAMLTPRAIARNQREQPSRD